jgi:hypothetical protein
MLPRGDRPSALTTTRGVSQYPYLEPTASCGGMYSAMTEVFAPDVIDEYACRLKVVPRERTFDVRRLVVSLTLAGDWVSARRGGALASTSKGAIRTEWERWEWV